MKNHWIKRKDDRELKEFYEKCGEPQTGGPLKFRKFLKAMKDAFDNPAPRVLTVAETHKLYGNECHCKCKGFKTNMGHTEECLEQLSPKTYLIFGFKTPEKHMIKMVDGK